MFCPDAAGHSAAQTACQNSGMELIGIESFGENTWLRQHDIGQSFSTGIRYENGRWRWPVQSAPVDFQQWDFDPENLACAYYTRVLGDVCCPAGTWHSESCGAEARRGYICERALAAGNCGDGILHPGEACDDGNQVNHDGCDNQCRQELCLRLTDANGALAASIDFTSSFTLQFNIYIPAQDDGGQALSLAGTSLFDHRSANGSRMELKFSGNQELVISWTGADLNPFLPAAALQRDRWHEIVLVYDAQTRRRSLYVDNAREIQDNNTNAPTVIGQAGLTTHFGRNANAQTAVGIEYRNIRVSNTARYQTEQRRPIRNDLFRINHYEMDDQTIMRFQDMRLSAPNVLQAEGARDNQGAFVGGTQLVRCSE